MSAKTIVRVFLGAALLVGCVRNDPLAMKAPPRAYAIVGVSVVFPERDTDVVLKDATVVVKDEWILAVGPSATTPVPSDGGKIIDGHGKWLIPGLIDGHVHFFQSGNPYTRPDAADFNAVVPYAKEVARNQARLPATFKVWLASGVTSVIDVGGPFWNFSVRDAAQKSAAAPRVETTGPLISMVDRKALDLGDPPIVKTSTPDEARALVARQLPYKPDYIKIWFIHQKGDDLAAQSAIVKATAEATHQAGLRLAVHATELEVAKEALRDGTDYLVHSVFEEPIDDEFIALMREHKALICPTLFVTNGYRIVLSGQWQATPEEQRLADPEILAHMNDVSTLPADKLPPRIAKLVAEKKPIPAPTVSMQNLKKLSDAGIPIVMGTDAGNIGTLHGPSVFREMRLMQDAGLTPLQVLRSATAGGAKAMGRDDLGAIAPGKRADLVLLDADPLVDVGNLSHASAVIKGGVVYDPAELIKSLR